MATRPSPSATFWTASSSVPLGVLLTLFNLIAALPVIGDIPGMSILIGTLILMVLAKSFMGGGSL